MIKKRCRIVLIDTNQASHCFLLFLFFQTRLPLTGGALHKFISNILDNDSFENDVIIRIFLALQIIYKSICITHYNNNNFRSTCFRSLGDGGLYIMILHPICSIFARAPVSSGLVSQLVTMYVMYRLGQYFDEVPVVI